MGGRYPGQTISTDLGKTSEDDVVFRPAKGARVELTAILVVLASHIELRRMHGTALKSQGGDDQTFRNIDVNGLFIQGSSRVSVIGGDVGPLENHDSQVTSFAGRAPSQILFDRVYFHDARKTDPSAHTECLQFGAGVDVVIRRSRFQRCSDHDVFVRSWGELNGSQHPLRNWTIENNFFDKTVRGHYSLRLAFKDGWPCENFLIRNNSALQNMYSNCEAKGVRFLANIQPTKSGFSCTVGGGSVWDWNVYAAGVPCGPHDVVAAPGFRAASSLDLHLVRGAAAVGHGAPGSVPETDIDGERRPQSGRPDAGADER